MASYDELIWVTGRWVDMGDWPLAWRSTAGQQQAPSAHYLSWRAPRTRDTARPVSRIPYSVIPESRLYPFIPYPISHYPVSRIPLSQYPVPRIPYSASSIPCPVSHSPNPIIPYPTYPGEGGNDLISSNARTTTVFYQGILSRSLSFLILCKILWL